MKVLGECEVSSNALIDSPVTVTRGTRTYTFLPSARGSIGRIQILAPADRPERFRSELIPTPGQTADWQMTLNTDEDLLDSIERDFQELEGHMALFLGLTRIRWSEMKWELVFDAPEERTATQVFGFQERRRHREPPVQVEKKGLEDLVSNIGAHPTLVAPLAFLREGNSDFASFRFINAFFNFYFVLEGLFGNGKTKNPAVEKAFKDSPALVRALTDMLPELKRRDIKVWARLQSECAVFNQALNAEGAIRLLVRTRGRLHHFSNNPKRREGTPLSQKDFEHAAELARSAAIFGLMYRVVELNTGRGR